MRLLSDEVWQVIKEYVQTYKEYEPSDELREVLEKHTVIECFDGGVFISVGNEFDLFVVPEKRCHWRIRSVVGEYLSRMGNIHGTLIAKIDVRNMTSLRLAKFFGFNETCRENGIIQMEKYHG